MLPFLIAAVLWLVPALRVWAALAALYAGYKYFVHRATAPGEPVFLTGWVPWLGLGADLGQKGAAEFLRLLKRRYGEVVATYICGRRYVFLMDPLSAPAFFKHRHLSFRPVVAGFVRDGFGSQDAAAAVAADAHEPHEQYVRYLQGRSLEPLSLRMAEKLEGALASQPEFAHGLPGSGLHDFVRRVMFAAGAETVFGSASANEETLGQFVTFDSQFPALAMRAPKLGPVARAVAAREAMNRSMVPALLRQRDDLSEWQRARLDFLDATGLPPLEAARLQTSIFWALHGNTIPATFWTVAHVAAAGPALQRELRREIREAVRACEPESDWARPRFVAATLARLEKLHSCITETLRMTSDSFYIRQVDEDTEIDVVPTAKEREGTRRVRLRKGDLVVMNPIVGHLDPEVFPQPHVFKPFRHVGAPGTSGHPVDVRGLKLNAPVSPFGGGVSMCPGRMFARNEVALFCCRLFWGHELVLAGRSDGEKSIPYPDFDRSRVGIGILHPKGDVSFRLRPVAAADE